MNTHEISLTGLSQNPVARPGEDWSGKADKKERKKLQDRINQRISRQFPHDDYSSMHWLTFSIADHGFRPA
jgi:hypothetical protein